jgi:multicomponent Na+:H+ antiporter subunit G
MTDWISALFLVSGGLFCLIAGIGVVRLPDIYLRMHASTKSGTLGLCLICVAVMIEAESLANVLEALFVFLFMIATAPVGAHLIGRAAFRSRIAEAPGTGHDPDCAAFRDGR